MGAIIAHQNDAVICVVTRMKFHAVIGAITTSKNRVTKAIMRQVREIVPIFGESELCVYR